MAATAFGLGGARLFGDESTYEVIRRTVLAFGVPAWWPGGGYLLAPLLGEAILFDARVARPWFAALPAAPPKARPAPVAIVLLLVLDLVLAAAIAKKWIPR
jgi:hypothetical protein